MKQFAWPRTGQRCITLASALVMRECIGVKVRDILREAGQTALMVIHSEAQAQMMGGHIGQVHQRQYRAL